MSWSATINAMKKDHRFIKEWVDFFLYLQSENNGDNPADFSKKTDEIKPCQLIRKPLPTSLWS